MLMLGMRQGGWAYQVSMNQPATGIASPSLVLTQQCLGPMKGDFPAMGPFPFVALDSVPEVLKTEDLACPVEVGTFTLNEDKTKVVSAASEI